MVRRGTESPGKKFPGKEWGEGKRAKVSFWG